MAVVQQQHDHTTADVLLMLYIVSKVNATEWFVHGMTTLQESQRNGSISSPVAKWPTIKPTGN